MVKPKIVRVNQDAAIACAFIYSGKDYLTNEELSSYLDIVKGLLPENHILFGVPNAAEFVATRYGVIAPVLEGYQAVEPYEVFNEYFLFRTPSYLKDIFHTACLILNNIEEETDDIKSEENMNLIRTI